MSKNKKILVLGKSGMLGSLLYLYLSHSSSHSVLGTVRNQSLVDKNKTIAFKVDDFLFQKKRDFNYLFEFDYIINCLGLIKPYCQDNNQTGVNQAILVNALFPHELSRFLKKGKTKIIQIATDCVFSGKKGNYAEKDFHDALDVYGKTKSLGEVKNHNFLNIRCSIIGPEKRGFLSLFEWLMSQKEKSEVTGFTHHFWNGTTTLQFSQLCLKIIENNIFRDLIKVNNTYHFVPNESLTKYQLLKLISKIFRKNLKIIPKENIGLPINRILKTNYVNLTSLFGSSQMYKALQELKDYLTDHKNEYPHF